MTSRIRDLTRTYDWYIYHGGCSSYDVIAPWPDLTWSICFYQKLRKVCPIRYTKTRRRYAPSFFRYLRKTLGGLHPPVRAKVKRLENRIFKNRKLFYQTFNIEMVCSFSLYWNLYWKHMLDMMGLTYRVSELPWDEYLFHEAFCDLVLSISLLRMFACRHLPQLIKNHIQTNPLPVILPRTVRY